MKTKLATAIALSLLAGTTFAAPTFYPFSRKTSPFRAGI